MFARSLARSFGAARTLSTVSAKAIVYSEYGQPLDVIKTAAYQLPGPDSLEDDQVLVKTLAVPLNPSDINQIQGVYPSRPKMALDFVPGLSEPAAVGGNEGVFQVLGVGPKVTSLKAGDWCIPSNVNYGTWRSHSISPESAFMAIPNDIPLTQAATMAVNTSSAFLMVTHFVDLKPGDWFIQNGGNSQVGRCAIQIAKSRGINSISIVRSRDNIDELVAELEALGATHVITEEDNGSREFGKTIKGWLDGKTIQLGLNCVGGPSVTGLSRKLGKNATLLTYGGMSMKPVALPTSLFIFKNLEARGFWITEMTKQDPQLRSSTINECIKLIKNGDLAPIHCQVNKVEPVEATSDAAFVNQFKQGLTDSKTNGKQLMVFDEVANL